MNLYHGDCLEVMRGMASNSVDSIVTDPPYGLSFMGKNWDHGVPGIPFWVEALRVAKPGAFLVAFGGTRTHHRLMVAIEDAGWEIRDTLSWMYGSGFPKSLDVGKAIDKEAGAERRIVGSKVGQPGYSLAVDKGRGTYNPDGRDSEIECSITAPSTDLAKQWDGWGTALKPGWEPIILARKPPEGTVAQCVSEHRTGALNIDGCRIGTEQTVTIRNGNSGGNGAYGRDERVLSRVNPPGRWPANVVLSHTEDCREVGTRKVKAISGGRIGKKDMGTVAGTPAGRYERGDPGYGDADGMETVTAWECSAECPVRLLDEQSGQSKSTGGGGKREAGADTRNGIYGKYGERVLPDNVGLGDTGGASRFYYCAKASRREREAGLEEMPRDGKRVVMASSERTQINGQWVETHSEPIPRTNHHPTVKPLSLMRWLCRLITPPNGLILDPFAGSFTTGCAAVLEGFKFDGIEQEEEYIEIGRRRIAYWERQAMEEAKRATLDLFDE